MSSRPQVGIDRLPTRRMSAERESMNCKSCRKRKIKCNRIKPICEACKIFQCACVYDAIPKKRGPKTDVLESLLKRVDGLERRLQDENKPDPESKEAATIKNDDTNIETVPGGQSEPSPVVLPDTLMEIFFGRIHGKPYYILDEATVRQTHQIGQLSASLLMAIYAVSARYAAYPSGYNAAVRIGQEYAIKTREAVDIDEPSIENLQALLLLSMAFFAGGRGKKAYMTLSNAIGMAFALDLHRELPMKAKTLPHEREMRRQLFWTCYHMDRFTACGSKRPSLISDKSILLRLPSYLPHPLAPSMEGELFNAGPNIQYSQDPRRKTQGAAGLLIDIVRILGITNRYLAAGGVKGDSHFPWHSLSNLSKIRQELDVWAAGTQDTFASVETLFGQPESTTLLLSKLVYHLVHCLIYRPFLPIDLAELRGTGQHQSWQIEATNLCFLHANAMAELVELGRGSPSVEWPAFVGYCICTAGTVFVHGVHYKGREGEVFSSSADFLARAMQQLSWLRSLWAGVQHQRETLQNIYSAHTELVTSLANNPMRFSPVFHLEDFYDRYPDQNFDGSHITFADVVVEAVHESLAAHDRDRNSNLLAQQGFEMPPPPSTTIQEAQYFPAAQQTDSSQHQPSTGLSHRHRHRPKPRKRSSIQGSSHGPELQPSSSSITTFQQFSPAHTQTHMPPLSSSEALGMASGFSPLPDFSSLPNLPDISPSAFPFSPPAFSIPSDLLFPAPTPPPNLQYANFPFDQFRQQSSSTRTPLQLNTANTPSAQSQASGSHATENSATSVEKDPFLSLLEQLAENEQLDLLGGDLGDFGQDGDRNLVQ